MDRTGKQEFSKGFDKPLKCVIAVVGIGIQMEQMKQGMDGKKTLPQRVPNARNVTKLGVLLVCQHVGLKG